jgi:excinuclease ABC subunit C
MIVIEDGKFKKADYRIFSIKETAGIDDYGSLREALTRRFARLAEDTQGAFSVRPDLLLLDGGKGHVSVGKQVLARSRARHSGFRDGQGRIP